VLSPGEYDEYEYGEYDGMIPVPLFDDGSNRFPLIYPNFANIERVVTKLGLQTKLQKTILCCKLLDVAGKIHCVSKKRANFDEL